MLHLDHAYQKSITKFIENAEDLDIVIAMYNLFEYRDNYSMTSGSVQNYYRDEVNDDENENDNANSRINNNKTITSKSFEYKTKLKGSIPDDKNKLTAEATVPLKHLSNFWRFLGLPLITVKQNLICHGQKNV